MHISKYFPQNRQNHIALINDNCTDALHLQRALRNESFVVSRFFTGEQALKYFRDNSNPHAVILNTQLTDKNGFQVAAELRKFGEFPIIYLGHPNESESLCSALHQLADDYVLMPYAIQEVVARVHRIVSRVPQYPPFENQVYRLANQSERPVAYRQVT